ncbi:MAG TPA: NUDIX domain-containing protein [Patescibacteria group bacterium]|nr:NUDIX domain-containing protein [Patescibacteria group bacterium]
MHKSFYASGILYDINSQQILLHQVITPFSKSCDMLGGENEEGEEPQITLQRIIKDTLNIKIDEKEIIPVYDYFDDALNLVHYVLYVELKKIPEQALLNNNSMTWFTFKQTLKLPINKQTKQDLIVIQRVINAEERKLEVHTKEDTDSINQ